MINEDISKLDIDDVFNEYKNIDVIVEGPTCQGFSQKGKRKIMDDPRNYLFKYFFEVVSVVRPKYFVLENVPNILTAILKTKFIAYVPVMVTRYDEGRLSRMLVFMMTTL